MIQGTDIPLPKVPTYSFLMSILPVFLRFITRVRYRGIHRIPRSGPAIIAANHLSHADPFIVIAGCRRRLHYLAKDSHFKHFHSAFVMRATGQIRTHRESGARDAIARGSDILEGGRVMGIFPEGTRSRREAPPFLQPGKTGVARLAASHPNVPVIPAAISNSRDIMKPGDKMARLWAPVNCNYGEAITWNEWLQHAAGGAVDEEEASGIIAMEEHGRRAALGGLYRKFTDQMIGTLAAMGAP
jgi:1-acyl-sn-glycerol-3-phosphate acyltransferase